MLSQKWLFLTSFILIILPREHGCSQLLCAPQDRAWMETLHSQSSVWEWWAVCGLAEQAFIYPFSFIFLLCSILLLQLLKTSPYQKLKRLPERSNFLKVISFLLLWKKRHKGKKSIKEKLWICFLLRKHQMIGFYKHTKWEKENGACSLTRWMGSKSRGQV